MCRKCIETLFTNCAKCVILYKTGLGFEASVIGISLKHNQILDAAIAEINDKQYPDKSVEHTGEIHLVGISYGDDRYAKH